MMLLQSIIDREDDMDEEDRDYDLMDRVTKHAELGAIILAGLTIFYVLAQFVRWYYWLR